MSSEAEAVLRVSQRAAARQTRRQPVELAQEEGARLAEGTQFAVAALAAIAGRARDLPGRSARVRALGLECRPDSGYLP